jgi:hypothetical protein
MASTTIPSSSRTELPPGLTSFEAEKQKEVERSDSLGQAEFLKLMMAQLKNQDPMQPMENGEFLGQMAQFSTVNSVGEMAKELKGLSDQMASISNSEALGIASGASAGGSGGFGGKGLSFLGVDSTGQRILLAFDVSSSVENKADKAGIPFSKISQEIQTLLQKLPITSRFGIIQFSRLFMTFGNELVPASNPNRQAANLWIGEYFGKVPTKSAKDKVRSGLLGVLAFAKELKPDVVFIVSDGSFQSEQYESGIPWDEVKKSIEAIKDESGKAARINFIAFEPKEEDLKELKKAAARSNGKVQEIK